jgi:acyl-coenzyme A thioesterase PaaI-like protein
MTQNKTLSIYRKLKWLPFGKKIFSLVVSRVAPYFATISPTITELVPNQCTCMIKKKKKVFNHIKTVHVIAICNGLEMAMGVMAEASIPKNLRWIPKGMTVDYTAKAGSDIRCVASVNQDDWQVGDMLVNITAYDENNVVVVKGTIKLWISEKPAA